MDKINDRRLWTHEDYDKEEMPNHQTEYDAIENYLDGIVKDKWPKEITIKEYKPMKIELNAEPLYEILDNLDINYNSPDRDASEPTDKMIQAEKEFLRIIEEEYTVWWFEETGKKIIVNVLNWVKTHQPNWL